MSGKPSFAGSIRRSTGTRSIATLEEQWAGSHAPEAAPGIQARNAAKRGNAVLFYSMVPDGRLDERSLHGGCKPSKEGAEKWGANQWIWNHPQRHSGVYPRRSAAANPRKAKGRPGCADSVDNCGVWAASGECDNNPAYMRKSCALSCGAC